MNRLAIPLTDIKKEEKRNNKDHEDLVWSQFGSLENHVLGRTQHLLPRQDARGLKITIVGAFRSRRTRTKGEVEDKGYRNRLELVQAYKQSKESLRNPKC